MFKKLVFFALSLFLSGWAKSQNLVINSGFENFISCPTNTGQIDSLVNWHTFWSGTTPDAFNACTGGVAGMPNNGISFEYAHSGGGMAGMVTYDRNYPNYREPIVAQLTDSLQQGQRYYMSFYANCACYGSHNMAANKLGIIFTKKIGIFFGLPNWSHLVMDSIYTDDTNWLKVSGSFIADSNYKYINIGNFFDAQHTDTLIISDPSTHGDAYYFIDDICVSKDAGTCGIVGIKELLKPNSVVRVVPNPVTDILTLKSTTSIENSTIEILDASGRTVLTANYKSIINVELLQQGYYTLKISTNDSRIYHASFIKE